MIERNMIPPLKMRTYQIRWSDGQTMNVQAVRVENACNLAQRKRHDSALKEEGKAQGTTKYYWRHLKVKSAETPIIACVETS